MGSRSAALMLATLLGCTSTAEPPTAGAAKAEDAAGRVASGFPGPEALSELRDQPLRPGSPFGTSYRDIGSWDLAGPFPDRAPSPARRGGEPWDALVDELLRDREGLAIATGSMECFAREAGRFLVELQALPGLGVQRFLAGRCAVVTAPPSFVTLAWESSRSLSIGEAVDELGEQIADALRRHVVGGPLDVGMWLHSAAGRVDMIIVRGRRDVRLDPLPMVAEGPVILSGEVLRTVSRVGAAVTRGRLGWADCELDEAIPLPRFSFVCPVAPGDPTTWVSVQYLAPGHVLPRSAAQLLIRSAGVEASSYRRYAYADARPVSNAEELPAAFLEVLNQVRARAGAPPLLLAQEQSGVAAEVAPYYFSAALDPGSEGVAELVALGMMAGWEVPGIVQEGFFMFMWLVESLDVASLLSDALDSPGARMTLLAKDLERIALGPMVGAEGETPYLALIASTYRLFSEREHRQNANEVIESLTRARARRGRAAPRPLDGAQPLSLAAAARIHAGGEPRRVLGDLIRTSVDRLGRPVVGWLAETQELDAIVFPENFLDPDSLELAVAVSTRKPEGEAWGRYVVLMLAAPPEQRPL